MTEGQWQSLERSAILVVEDEPALLEAISRFLRDEGYEVLCASDLEAARGLLAERDVFLVLSDVGLPGGESGLDLLADVRERPGVDALIMTAQSDVESAVRALNEGAHEYLCKPFPFEVLRAVVTRAVSRRRLTEKARMLEQLETRQAAEEEQLEQFLVSMATVIDAKSRYTSRHSHRVSALCRIAAEAMGLDEAGCELVALGGRLHDIGKIGTPDAILDKPGRLTDAEYDVIKAHPAQGDDLIAPIRSLANLRPMIRWHHESLDGRGYPDGLTGDEVPREAWIVKVADYWEAITSQRPYREPMSPDEAVRCLRSEADVRIPRDVVETFLEAIQGAPVALPALASV